MSQCQDHDWWGEEEPPVSNTEVGISASSHCKAGRNTMLECKPENHSGWKHRDTLLLKESWSGRVTRQWAGKDWNQELRWRRSLSTRWPWASNPVSPSLTFCHRAATSAKWGCSLDQSGRMNVKGTKTACAFPRWVLSFYRSQTAPYLSPTYTTAVTPPDTFLAPEETRSGHSEVWSPTPKLSFPSGVRQHFCLAFYKVVFQYS